MVTKRMDRSTIHRLIDGMEYSPAAAHSDPNYLRRKFRAVDPNWNKPTREPASRRIIPANANPADLKLVKR